MTMSKSGLGILLSKLRVFENPSAVLEQYPTTPELAAEVCHLAFMRGDIEGKRVADLGAGTGILGIGALLLNAKEVFFVEKDEGAVEMLRENIAKISNLAGRGKDIEKRAKIIIHDINDFHERVDSVIMNPPFGMKKRHADSPFLDKALEIADVVYSIHNSKSMGFLRRKASRYGFALSTFGASLKIRGKMSFHRKRIHTINTLIACFVRE